MIRSDGRGKGEWTGDNQQTAAAFFLVYNPTGPTGAIDSEDGIPTTRRQQLGYFRRDGDVDNSRAARRRTTSTCSCRPCC